MALTRAQRRYYRTIFLGVAAMGALVWSAMDQFDLSPAEVRESFMTAFLLVSLIVLAGAALAALWVIARKLLARKNGR